MCFRCKYTKLSARLAHSHSFRSCFLSVSSLYVLRNKSTNTRTYCTEFLPTRYYWLIEKNHMFPTQKCQNLGSLAIIYSCVSSFWSVCKTFFRRKSTTILARSLRSLDIIFLKFHVSNEQDHFTSVTNTRTWIILLYRQTMWFINNVYIEIWEESYVFRPKNTKKFGSLAISR